MINLFISRKDYDKLVLNHPAFMATKYMKLKHSWTLSGVTVSGSQQLVDEVKELLKVTS